MGDVVYPVSELFASCQGEGYNTGSPVLFIRLAGCNRSCFWCDERNKYVTAHNMSIADIVEYCKIKNKDKRPIIFTGGEPTIHNIQPLVRQLRADLGCPMWIESNGTGDMRVYYDFDYLSISPKYEDMINDTIDWRGFRDFCKDESKDAEVRIVCDYDTLIPIHHFDKLNFFPHKYLSPVCKNNGDFSLGLTCLYPFYEQLKINGWQISIQTHKLANIR